MNLLKTNPSNIAELVSNAIAARKNYSAKRLVAPGPSPLQIEKVFESAASAPDHGNLTPWRFILIPGDKRSLLGDAFAAALLERDPNATLAEIQSAKAKAFNAPFLAVAVVDQSATRSSIPNHEKLISLGCAIQNILVTATVMGFGSGLTSGKAMASPSIRQLLQLKDDEICACFINIGSIESEPKITRLRPPLMNYLSTL